jgi:signal transduction histidine kinase/CheY-like chemotaxis protein
VELGGARGGAPVGAALASGLLAVVPDPVAVIGDGTVRRLNPSARALAGPRVEEGMPAAALAALLPAGRRAVLADVSATLAAGRGWRGPLDLLDPDGVAAAHLVTVTPVPDGAVVLARPLAEVRAREAAERECRDRDELIARMGHELRTPLNAVLGFAQLLELDDLTAEQREDVGHMLTAGRHMQELIDEMLDLTQVRAGAVDLDVGPVPVLDVVHGVRELIGPLAIRRGIQTRVAPDPPLMVLADRRRLWQVLLNLVSNAVKYGREGGAIRIGVAAVAGGRVRLEVEDDGPGIAPEALSRLFAPFERLGAERTGVEGWGLGLAVSKALVTAMDGNLSATSRPGTGSVFAVELAGVGPAPESGDAVGPPRSRLIIYVGCDPAAQALVAQSLKAHLAAETVAVTRAALVADAVRRTAPALVLVDGDLPDATAQEVLQRLAGDPLTATVPRIATAADHDPRVRLRLRAAGAGQVLDLPLDLREWLDSAGRHLAGR